MAGIHLRIASHRFSQKCLSTSRDANNGFRQITR
jgi:hypothetical protein